MCFLICDFALDFAVFPFPDATLHADDPESQSQATSEIFLVMKHWDYLFSATLTSHLLPFAKQRHQQQWINQMRRTRKSRFSDATNISATREIRDQRLYIVNKWAIAILHAVLSCLLSI